MKINFGTYLPAHLVVLPRFADATKLVPDDLLIPSYQWVLKASYHVLRCVEPSINQLH